MPRDGSSVYHIPLGTEGIPDTTIESDKYNNYIHDVASDLNAPRPIVAGGTGATNAPAALVALGGENASQVVTNYDSQIWRPGSFYSAAGATNAPVAGHAFVGLVVSSDPLVEPPTNLNVVVHARDQNDIVIPGRLYVREKKAGVWGPWSLDGTGLSGSTPPLDAPDNTLFWDAVGGELYIYYNDGNSKQWVITSPQADISHFLLKAGDTMTGTLTLHADPAAVLEAATKQYVDAQVAAGVASIVIFPPGTTMLFVQSAAPVGWTKRTDLNDFALRVVSGNVGTVGGQPFSSLFVSTNVGGHAVTPNEMPYHVHGAAIYDPSHAHSGSVALQSTLSGVASGGVTQAGGSTPLTINPSATGVRVWDGTNFDITGGAGGNAPHVHSINLSLSYVDVIMAVKN